MIHGHIPSQDLETFQRWAIAVDDQLTEAVAAVLAHENPEAVGEISRREGIMSSDRSSADLAAEVIEKTWAFNEDLDTPAWFTPGFHMVLWVSTWAQWLMDYVDEVTQHGAHRAINRCRSSSKRSTPLSNTSTDSYALSKPPDTSLPVPAASIDPSRNARSPPRHPSRIQKLTGPSGCPPAQPALLLLATNTAITGDRGMAAFSEFNAILLRMEASSNRAEHATYIFMDRRAFRHLRGRRPT